VVFRIKRSSGESTTHAADQRQREQQHRKHDRDAVTQ
jgi:hypothetical protein